MLTKDKEKKLAKTIEDLKLTNEDFKKVSVDLIDKITNTSKCSEFEVMYYIKYCRN